MLRLLHWQLKGDASDILPILTLVVFFCHARCIDLSCHLWALHLLLYDLEVFILSDFILEAARCLYLYLDGVSCFGLFLRHRIITILHKLRDVAVEAKADSGWAISSTWNDAIHDLESELLSLRFSRHFRSCRHLQIVYGAVLTFLLSMLLILLLIHTMHLETPFEVLHR